METEKITTAKLRAIKIGGSEVFYVGVGNGYAVRVARSLCTRMRKIEGIKYGYKLSVKDESDHKGFIIIRKYAV